MPVLTPRGPDDYFISWCTCCHLGPRSNPIFFLYPTRYQMGTQGNSGLYLVLCINSMSLKCSMIVTLWFWVLITIYLGVIRVQTIEMTSLSALLPPNKMADCCVLWPTKSDRFPTPWQLHSDRWHSARDRRCIDIHRGKKSQIMLHHATVNEVYL